VSGSKPEVAQAADDGSARERILLAAEELFAEAGFDATPTSRIAERASVPKGLVHYYFRRKPDLLVALVERLPEEAVLGEDVVVPGDVAASLRRLVAALDATLDSSALLSHLLWREADTHEAVRCAVQARYRRIVAQIRAVIVAALNPAGPARIDGDVDSDVDSAVDSAAELLALAVSYRHSVARHEGGCAGGGAPDPTGRIDREIDFLAAALRVNSAVSAG
jgi:AcrR family transcriptional regulator